MRVLDPSVRLATAERLLDTHFPPPRFRHRLIACAGTRDFEPLVDEARRAGYDVSVERFMVARGAPPREAPGGEFSVSLLASDSDWRDLDALAAASFGSGTTGFEQMRRRWRHLTAALRIRWLVARDADGRIAGQLGVFDEGPVSRLQEVVTHPEFRRRGVATLLVGDAMRGAAGRPVVACVDVGYHALALYEGLGFRGVGEDVAMLRVG